MTIDVDFLIQTFFVALTGVPTTLKITLVALLIATPVSYFMAISKINNTPFVRHIVTFYVSFVRGTPVVVQILIIYSLLPSLLSLFLKSIGSSFNVFEVDEIIYAYTVFSLYTIANLSEVFRSALLTVDKGQLEAAQSIGISNVSAYTRIIIPQALVVALPNICNVTINLIKSTSLAFIMTVKDITALAKMEAAQGYNYIEAYLDILIVYIIVCASVEFIFKLFEKRLKVYKANIT